MVTCHDILNGMHRRTASLCAAALLVIAGCASGDDTAGTSTTTSPASTASPSPSESSGSASATPGETQRAVEISVAVSDGKVRPKPRRVEVEKDSRVRLLVTVDIDDQVHVHGYDIEEPLEAGRTTTVEFVADQSGVFEVETHDSGLALLQLEVR
jgi:uncharacterized lipoprotein YajG